MSELREEIKYDVLVPLVIDMVQKREREKGSLVKRSSHVEYDAAVDAIVDAVIEALPLSRVQGTTRETTEYWAGHESYRSDVIAILEAAKSQENTNG